MKDDIPYGNRCCEIIGLTDTGILQTRLCPYYTHIEDGLVECTLLKITSEEEESLDNQYKICGFNEENCDYQEKGFDQE